MHQRFLFSLLGIILFILMLTGCGTEKATTSSATPPQQIELTISAAVSLKDALTEIKKNYEASHADIKLTYNLGASGSLQQQIEQGAPADLFISAAPKQMNDLAAKKLILPATRKNLVENKLVIIVPKSSNLTITKYEDLTSQAVQKVSLGETNSVPAGQYAQEVLSKMGIWDTIKTKAVLAKDVRTVLTYVETGNVEAGIVYQTDAISSDKVKIVATAPEGSHQPIVYPAAVLSATKQEKVASEFLTYLSTAECTKIFEKYGFTISK